MPVFMLFMDWHCVREILDHNEKGSLSPRLAVFNQYFWAHIRIFMIITDTMNSWCFWIIILFPRLALLSILMLIQKIIQSDFVYPLHAIFPKYFKIMFCIAAVTYSSKLF